MPRFVVIFGPSAVGKMTVGRELAMLTGFKLFHNHHTIELVRQFFPHGPTFRKLVNEFRIRLIEEVAESDLPGLIFTYVWALERPEDKAEIDSYATLFEDAFYIELEASQAVRLARNETPLRLQEKPSKRDVEWSRNNLLHTDGTAQLNTRDSFFYPARHLKIRNDDVEPEEAARRIRDWIHSCP